MVSEGSEVVPVRWSRARDRATRLQGPLGRRRACSWIALVGGISHSIARVE